VAGLLTEATVRRSDALPWARSLPWKKEQSGLGKLYRTAGIVRREQCFTPHPYAYIEACIYIYIYTYIYT